MEKTKIIFYLNETDIYENINQHIFKSLKILFLKMINYN